VTAGEPRTSFRPRSAYLGYLVVGRGDDAVLIEPTVAGELRIAAARAGLRPAAGLLYGHAWYDDEGGYTLVDGFVPAESGGLFPAEADPVAVRARLRAEALRSYPGAEEVGWWRTAPRPGEDGWQDPGAWPLSERPDGVGLVVFADGTPPTTAAYTPRNLVQGSVLDEWTAVEPPAREPEPAEEEDPLMEPATLQAAHAAPPPNAGPTRGRVVQPVQSPQLVQQDELKGRRRHEPESRGRLLEVQQWVLLAMVVLVLVVVITVVVMVGRIVS
jgi:hypothetical protein